MHRANSLTEAFAKDARNALKPGPAFNEQMNQAMVLTEISRTFAFDDVSMSLKNALNDFYKEPLNTRIPVPMALEHVRDQLGGRKTAGQLLDELNDWRKILNGSSK